MAVATGRPIVDGAVRQEVARAVLRTVPAQARRACVIAEAAVAGVIGLGFLACRGVVRVGIGVGIGVSG
ncbi:hypothetical protein [Mycobacterium sp.]|uniref:hypothetical protein n=1 Tax=Mycobacterium sp. TaxID=1785 RepID=UPI003C750864